MDYERIKQWWVKVGSLKDVSRKRTIREFIEDSILDIIAMVIFVAFVILILAAYGSPLLR